MALTTNGINIDKLDFTPEEIVIKSLQEYQKEIKKTIERIQKDAKKGITIFRDNTEIVYEKPSLKLDF